MKAPPARGDHDRLKEHAMIDPGALVQPAVNREDHTDWSIEEGEVAIMLRTHLLHFAAANPEKTVKRKADSTPACQIRFEEAVGVIDIFVPDRLFRTDSGIQNSIRKLLLLHVGDDVDFPGLHIGPGGSPRRDAQDVFNRLLINTIGQEGAD